VLSVSTFRPLGPKSISQKVESRYRITAFPVIILAVDNAGFFPDLVPARMLETAPLDLRVALLLAFCFCSVPHHRRHSGQTACQDDFCPSICPMHNEETSWQVPD